MPERSLRILVKMCFLVIGPAILIYCGATIKDSFDGIGIHPMFHAILTGGGILGTIYSITKLYEWSNK